MRGTEETLLLLSLFFSVKLWEGGGGKASPVRRFRRPRLGMGLEAIEIGY